MFEGYLRNGGVEVINVERTMAYIKAGLAPPGSNIEAPVECEGLSTVLGVEAYRTPALDDAPWFDPANSDTSDFAGVLPLGITGMDGTTRAVTITERTSDGGTPSAPRRGPRTIAASALLVGRTAAATAHGLLWLSTVLHRSCEPDADCEGTTLEGFLVCPELGDPEDITAAVVPTTIPRDGTWPAYGGTWDPATNVFTVAKAGEDPAEVGLDGGTAAAPTDSGPAGDGGSADTEPAPGVDGGELEPLSGEVADGGQPGSDLTESLDGGNPNPFDAEVTDGGPPAPTAAPAVVSARLALPEVLSCVSRVEVVWQVRARTTDTDGSVTVRLGAIDVTGGELESGDPIVLSGDTTLTWTRDFVPWDSWRPAIFVEDPGLQVDASAIIRLRPLLSAADCVAPYRRSFSQVSCVDGPNVVSATDDASGSSMLQVEWTWVANDPYRYGESTNLVTGLPVTSNGAPTAEADHVGHTFLGTVTAAATVCAAPQEPVTCATDPTYPGFTAPPAAPVIIDPGAVSPTGYTRQQISIEDALVPDTGSAALRFIFVNSNTVKRGVRVRLYHLPEGGGVPTECAFEDEFWINFIPASAILTVDGITGQVIVDCPDNSSASAQRVMRGPYQGAFNFPTMRCGGAYLISLDVPSGTGALTVTLDSAPREG